jgi:hypothetical protein
MLLSLELDVDDFVVAGSGPLLARGLVASISDLDVVVTEAAWRIAVKEAKPEPAPFGPVNHVLMFDGALEILDGWFPELWTVAELIRTADEFEGIRFVNLGVVRRSKEILGRPVDLRHITLIDEFLARGGV